MDRDQREYPASGLLAWEEDHTKIGYRVHDVVAFV